MSPPDRLLPPFTGVILAAQRAGRIDPLAEAAGTSHKCLVAIEGAPLIAHVAAALRATPGLQALRIVVEPELFAPLQALLGGAIEFVEAAPNLADSVYAACRGVNGPIVVTTADNVLLTPAAVSAMRGALADGAEVTLAMARRAAVLAAHPEGQRRFYRFADDEYSNCNLYAFAGARAMHAAETFRSGGQFAKKPLRIVLALGPINLVLMLLHRLTLAGAATRMGRRFRLTLTPVVLADGAHAIDVDNARTFDAAAAILRQRAGARPAAQPVPQASTELA